MNEKFVEYDLPPFRFCTNHNDFVIFWYLTRAKTDAGFAKSALILKIKENK